jgi:hypothetical protein
LRNPKQFSVCLNTNNTQNPTHVLAIVNLISHVLLKTIINPKIKLTVYYLYNLDCLNSFFFKERKVFCYLGYSKIYKKTKIKRKNRSNCKIKLIKIDFIKIISLG